MYQVQGGDLFTYKAGSRFGPFDLSGLLALAGGGSGGTGTARRRALLQSTLVIESLDFDGRTLWRVLSTG